MKRTPGWNLIETLMTKPHVPVAVYIDDIIREYGYDPQYTMPYTTIQQYQNNYIRKGGVWSLAAHLLDELGGCWLIQQNDDEFSVVVRSKADARGMRFILQSLESMAGYVPATDQGRQLLELAWLYSDEPNEQRGFLRGIRDASNDLFGHHAVLANEVSYLSPLKMVVGLGVEEDLPCEAIEPVLVRIPLQSRDIFYEVALELQCPTNCVIVEYGNERVVPRLVFRMERDVPWSVLETATLAKLRTAIRRFARPHYTYESHRRNVKAVKSAYYF